MQKIIFTDLDGTLLDNETYSFEKAKEALRIIKKNNIPLIFCSSKTRAEIEHYREKIHNKGPFISENGGAIFIPKKYFKFKFHFDKKNEDYFIIELGIEYNILQEVIKKIKRNNIKISNFGNMAINEISKITNLSIKNVKFAKMRYYDEPFILHDKDKEKALLKIIKKNKLNYTKGTRFYHLIGKHDKGKAVKILIDLYKKKYNKIVTYAFGDSKIDFSMLNVVDNAYIVKNNYNQYYPKKYKKADGIGPEGFNKEILRILNN